MPQFNGYFQFPEAGLNFQPWQIPSASLKMLYIVALEKDQGARFLPARPKLALLPIVS
jgi:hypothetical protein